MNSKKSVQRVVFTREMRRTHTILLPNMLPIHFEIVKNVFSQHGYKVELLHNEGPRISTTGLKYVHNDTCYPALLVIGQFIDALQSGRYDVDRTALMITQTGGGCRASNYIHLAAQGPGQSGLWEGCRGQPEPPGDGAQLRLPSDAGHALSVRCRSYLRG